MWRQVGFLGVLIALAAGCGPSNNDSSDATGTAGNMGSSGGAGGNTPAVTGGSGAMTGGSGASAPGSGMPSGQGGSASGIAGSTTTAGDGGPSANNPNADAGADIGSDASVVMGPVEPQIPMPPEPCPMLATGFANIMGSNVQLWVGTKQEDKKAPIMIYWHFTGGSSGEAMTGLSPDAVTEILDAGGIIASPQNSTGQGADTGNGVWYTGDFEVADEVVACAVQQLNIDTHRIYTAGGSAGALQAGIMVYKRSSYLASSLPNSGGYTIGCNDLEDPSHVPAVMTMHGAPGVDVVIVDFSVQSMVLDVDVAKKGGFAIDCNHGGVHVGAPADLRAAGWQFLKDHPFGVSPWPYAGGLPSSFPQYCTIVQATDMAPEGCCSQFMQCMDSTTTTGGTGGS